MAFPRRIIKTINWFQHFFDDQPRLQKRIVLDQKTAYQRILIIDTYSFGRCLILDDELQSAELDESIYHESLVHPVFRENIKPQTALILGGGEGATLREIIKHPLNSIDMVDLDRDVVRYCIQYLSKWHRGSFHDERVKVYFQDARQFITSTQNMYDLIFMDLPSPAADNPIKSLYSFDYLKVLCQHLNPKGWLITQAGPVHPFYPHPLEKIYDNMSAFLKPVKLHSCFVPSFGMPWGFLRGQK